MAATTLKADFDDLMGRLGLIAPRIQIDLMDGEFAPHQNIAPSEVWWPEGVAADIHLMYLYPEEAVECLISLKPHMIIVHAEAQADVASLLERIQEADILAGVALLKETRVYDYEELIVIADHVLLFAGTLGENGEADLSVLEKVSQVHAVRMAEIARRPSSVEIGWDGGANQHNVVLLAGSGVDVINVGGALRNAEDPQGVYAELLLRVSDSG